MRGMADWITSWIPEEICGGIPGRQADDILSRFDEDLEEAMENGKLTGASIDLSKCFDREAQKASTKAMEHMGLDGNIGGLINRFYGDMDSWFIGRGLVHPTPVRRKNGLLQGCPFSMVMLAASMTVWVWKVKREVPDIRMGVFVDDRLLWSKSANGVEVVKAALELGKKLDSESARTWNEGK